MSRVVTPELLDQLAPEAPEARHSRRDLRWINRCLGTSRWFASALKRHLQPGDRVLELGAGESQLHRHATPGVTWHALDLAPCPPGWPDPAGWFQADVRSFDSWSRYSVIVGNLFFHHLTDDELSALGQQFRPFARLVLASEPERSRTMQRGFALLCWAIGAHAVTRHDGRVSIEAGFRKRELASVLGLTETAWDVRVATSWLGAHRLVAQRRSRL